MTEQTAVQPLATPAEPANRSGQTAGYAAVILAAATWGTSGLFVKAITQYTDISALALAFWRDLTTGAVMLLGLALLRPASLRIRRRDLPRLIGLGASIGAFHVLWNLCIILFGAAVATVQQSTMPALVVVAAWLLWKEPLTWRKIVGVLMAFGGIVLVTGPSQLAGMHISGGAWLAALGLPIGYAAWTLFGKSLRGQYDSPTVFAYGFAFGALVLLPLQFFTPQPTHVPPMGAVWFAGMIGQTILAFVAYAYGLGRLPAGIAGLLAMSEIVFVSFYAYFLLGERLVALQWAGVLLVVAGVLLPTLQRRTRAA